MKLVLSALVHDLDNIVFWLRRRWSPFTSGFVPYLLGPGPTQGQILRHSPTFLFRYATGFLPENLLFTIEAGNTYRFQPLIFQQQMLTATYHLSTAHCKCFQITDHAVPTSERYNVSYQVS